jgi:hypothetical protein
MARAAGRHATAARHRLHANRAHTARAQCIQQRATHQGFADIGVGAGNKPSVFHNVKIFIYMMFRRRDAETQRNSGLMARTRNTGLWMRI